MIYASCKDINGKIEYLVAPSEKDIDIYCENGVLGYEKALLHYYINPDPIMVCHHFTWVGKDRRPPILSISKPHDYSDPTDYSDPINKTFTKKSIEKW